MTTPHSATTGAPDFEAAMAWRASQVEEYSQWVAAQDIYVGNGLAYVKGDPVPASNVIAHDYDAAGMVVRPEGWADPVPGDGIEDAPTPAPSTVDGAQDGVAVKRTPKRGATDGNTGA